jgi:ribosomal protein L11 methyltransferase
LDKPGRTWPALDIRHVPEFLEAALTDYHVTAIHEGDEVWRIFFRSAAERDLAAAGLRAEFDGLSIQAVDVPDDDWAARSQASLRAVQIGRVIVAPPWDAPTTIVIQPSMGFGTGHHATTQLCLAALQQIDLRGMTVIDVGTGSGVLAMAASLLGAANVIGIDDDPDAVTAARENLTLNPRARVTLRVGDLRRMEPASADLVMANLTGALLVSAADRLRQLTDSGGRLILSGFMAREERDVLHAFAPLAVEHRAQEEEWLCVTLLGISRSS